MTKLTLGLDLGTNSIGWAVLNNENQKFEKSGSRIIPMDARAQGDYEAGTLQSPASERTGFRSIRKLNERAELRRERLFRVLHILGFLPKHFDESIDFVEHPGKFKNMDIPLLPYRKNHLGTNEFIFQDAFREMLHDFEIHQPKLVADGRKVPYDWTIYYLRKKALTQPVSREELAWIILNFNTKRGYYQLRGEEDEETNDNEEYAVLTVTDVVDQDADKPRLRVHEYEVTYNNGAVQTVKSDGAPWKKGDTVELIIKTTIKKDGSRKVTLRAPKEDDWKLVKKRTESDLDNSHQTVGTFIYDHLLSTPDIKVRGKLIHTIERKYYKDELLSILNEQAKYIPELSDNKMLNRCIEELYHNNYAHAQSALKDSLVNFLVNDIIFYQRPLKSKKSEIADCPFEYHWYKKKDGTLCRKYLKCIPRSHPLFQEFRLWQFVQNLKIFEKVKVIDGKLRTDVDVTSAFLDSKEKIADLFEWLNDKDKVNQKQILAAPVFGIKKADQERYRWNYVEDKSYPCNETRHEFLKRLKNVKGKPQLSDEQQVALWHILYSVDDRIELQKALCTFAEKQGIDAESFVDSFKDIKPFDNSYGAYSEKAIRKLLALMRCGKYWSENNIDPGTRNRIQKLIDGEADDRISTKTRESAAALHRVEDFQGLPLWLTSYVVYNRHSEPGDLAVWKTPEDIDMFLQKDFGQNSLRNPVVQSVLGEALRVTRDIWKKYGKISEVHIEMGRDLKQNKDQRSRTLANNLENQRVNLRARRMLQELVDPEYNVQGVRPNSPNQQEIYKIYEDYALHHDSDVPDDIRTIVLNLGNSSKTVAKSDIIRYRLWLEQQYLSPYTGQPIPLSRLFTSAYEIEHVIPQSRYYDNSFNNKVICEAEVNRDKGNMLGYEYILKKGGSIISGLGGKQFKILNRQQYEEFVRQHYFKNPRKKKQLLMEDIPEEFLNRQMNDSRYIARKALEIFSHLVREEGETTAVSKNVIATNGSITDKLKQVWGINDVWNGLMAPRFERLNRILHTDAFGHWEEKEGKRFFLTNVPIELSANFSKKRIDHRHHAMDAMIIACTTRDHVNYLNNMAAGSKERYDLRAKLCEGDAYYNFKKPWPTFTQDVKSQLENIIVSFKQNLRVINRTTNWFWHYEQGRKVLVRQTKGDAWAIRKPLHKDTVAGTVRLQEKKSVKLAEAVSHVNLIVDKKKRQIIRNVIKEYGSSVDNKTLLKYFKDRKYQVNGEDFTKLEIYHIPEQPSLSAHRVPLNADFTKKTIESVTDSGIRKILLAHLSHYCDEKGKEDPARAFSPEGILEMNNNIKVLNGGKEHKPILRVRMSETLGQKFAVGQTGNKVDKFVEAAKGTNLFFAVYADEDGNRSFYSLPLALAVERMKQGLPVAEPVDENGNKLLFTLSPLDLVYVPDEDDAKVDASSLNKSNIYKFISSTNNRAYFIPYSVAKVISDKLEYTALNKSEFDDQHRNIRQLCVKLEVDRLGNITKIIQ